MLKFAHPTPIKFLGVFDTVGAVGVPFPVLRRLRGSAYPFLNIGLRQNNEYAFHALAIDEHRKTFSPTLWTNQGATGATPRPMERTEQRWFVGAHANVGGGCFDDPLAQLPFKWLSVRRRRSASPSATDLLPNRMQPQRGFRIPTQNSCRASTGYSDHKFGAS